MARVLHGCGFSVSTKKQRPELPGTSAFAYVSGLKQILYYEFISKFLVYRTEVWFRFRRVCYYEFTVVVVICMLA